MIARLFHSTAVAVWIVLGVGAAGAQGLPPATGEVLLTVTGRIAVTNAHDAAQFDLGLLESLGPQTIRTGTIWTQGPQTFEGLPLNVLITALGITGQTLRATAINDYSVEIPITDAQEGGPIVAYRLNGKTMSVRDKGPLWIIYPYDLNSDFRSEVIYTRSIWQLDRIEATE
jgi:hypothetical protein